MEISQDPWGAIAKYNAMVDSDIKRRRKPNMVGRMIATCRASGVSYWDNGLLAVEAIGNCIISWYAYKMIRFVRFILTRDSKCLTVKAFGAFQHGPQGLHCMMQALTASRVYARSCGYGIWLLNADQDHPDRPTFPKSGFRTLWMQKWINQPTRNHGANEWPAFSTTAFCDPRNL